MKSKAIMGTLICFSVLSMQESDVYAQVQENDILIDKLNKIDERYAIESNVPVKKANIDMGVELGSLALNEKVQVLEVIGEWLKVEYKGEVGYVKSKYLKSDNNVRRFVYVDNTDKINVYENDWIGSKIVGHFEIMDCVEVIEESEDFIKVKFNEGVGYIKRDTTVIVDDIKRVVKSTSVLYGENGDRIEGVKGVIKNGVEVKVIENKGDYVKISGPNGVGYTLKESLVDIRVINRNSLMVEDLLTEGDVKGEILTHIPPSVEIEVLEYIGEYAKVKYGDYEGFVKKSTLSSMSTDIKSKVLIGEYKISSDFEISEVKEFLNNCLSKEVQFYNKKNKGLSDVDILIKYKDKIMKKIEKQFIDEFKISKINEDSVVRVIANFGTYYEVEIENKKYYVINRGCSEQELVQYASYIQALPTYNTKVSTRYVNDSTVKLYKVNQESAEKDIKEDKLMVLGYLAKDAMVELVKELHNGYSVVKVNGLMGVIKTQDISTEKLYRVVDNSVNYIETKKSHKDYVDVQAKRLNMVSTKKGMVKASYEDVARYSNPKKFGYGDNESKYQYLKLNRYRNVNAYKLNEYLNNIEVKSGKKAIFKDKGDVFIDSARKYNIDPVYLVSHMLLETGFGSSKLAQGVNYNNKGVVYNFFGIGAVDESPIKGACTLALENGWVTVDKAIEGAAKWLSDKYINNSKYGQDTLYKMRFNYMTKTHQYATDVGWAYKISKFMNELSYLYEDDTLEFEVPIYNKGSYVVKGAVKVESEEAVEVEKIEVPVIDDNVEAEGEAVEDNPIKPSKPVEDDIIIPEPPKEDDIIIPEPPKENDKIEIPVIPNSPDENIEADKEIIPSMSTEKMDN